MSGSRPASGPEVPPEVPPEFADAYRAAYEAAMREAAPPAPAPAPAPTPTPAARPRPTKPPREPRQRPERRPRPAPAKPAAESAEPDEPTVQVPLEPAAAKQDSHSRSEHTLVFFRPREDESTDEEPESEHERAGFLAKVQDSGWLVPVLLLVLAVVLVLGAYAVGRAFSHRVANSSGGEPRVLASENGKEVGQPVTRQKGGRGAWNGKVAGISGVTASADCTASPGVDAGGDTVTYTAKHLVDRVADTTWRCDGKAIGQVLTFDLGADVPVGEVGLIPGYAKTDEADGTDRYAENNRITKVRWRIGGTTVVQNIADDTKDRSLRLLRVPRTTADKVSLQILDVARGPRDTTAISEVLIARATK